MNITNLVEWIGGQISIASEQYVPASKGILGWNEYQRISQTNPIIKKCLKLKQANIGANGWKVQSKMFRSESKNEDIEWQIYNLLEKQVGIQNLYNDYSAHLGIFGNSILTFNQENKLILQSPTLYNQYFSTLEQKAMRYALLIDGVEQRGLLGNLQHGIDLYHFKNPDSSYKAWGESPIDSCYDWILFYQHAVQAQNMLASRGWVNILALIPENDKETQNYLKQKDEEGKTNAQTLSERFKTWFGGSKNAGKVAILSHMKEIREVGKTARDMEFIASQDVITQQIAHSYGFSLADLGKDVTYSNADTFNQAQYDLVGRKEERQFEHAINTFALPKLFNILGMENLASALENGDIYFQFEEPKDPNEQNNLQLHLNIVEKMIGFSDNPTYKAKLVNEFRDKLNLDPIEESMFELEEEKPQIQANSNNVVEVQAKENFAKKTPIEKALSSREFERTDSNGVKKGFRPHLENKVTEQLNNYVEIISKKKSFEDIISSIEADFPSITKFYKKKDIKKDLGVFAKMGYMNFLAETKKEKFEDIPEYITEAVNARASYLLGETKDYSGIDLFTRDQISTILQTNKNLELEELLGLITSKIPEIAKNRATIIAETEVGFGVENSRFLSYLQADYQWKRWLSVNDDRVRITHKSNESEGVIPIDKAFSNGNQKAGEEPYCRCSCIFGYTKEDIS